MYFNKEEDLGKEEFKLGYKEDNNDNDNNIEDEDEEEELYEISDRKFAPDPVPPLYISPLSWEDRDVITKNTYQICLPPYVMESHLLYGKGM